MNDPESYLFAGGGTGGHLFPGLAVAEELRARRPGCRVLFVGSERPIEAEILTGAGAEHVALPIRTAADLKRRLWRFCVDNLRAVRAAGRLLREHRPRVVLGLGGFASFPLLLQAQRQGIPFVLLEQNAIPGRVTRWQARRARAVCVAFPESMNLLTGANCQLTGNPVRRSIVQLAASSGLSEQRVLLILGGSQGAESLNQAVLLWAAGQREPLAGWTISHQTGPRQQAEVAAEYARLGIPAEVAPFWSDLPARYAAAGLVISRAGATTIAELLCAGQPMVLLPYPHAADDHQRANAAALARAGAAELVEHGADPAETAHRLTTVLSSLLSEPQRRRQLADAARRLARPEAARTVVDLLLDVAGQ